MKKILFSLLAIVFLYSGWSLLGPVVQKPKGGYFYIRTGASLQTVEDSLISSDIIPNRLFFSLLCYVSGYGSDVKPGRYEIIEGSNLISLIRMLKSGRQSPVRLVINKLRTRYDLAGKIARNTETDSITAIGILNSNDSLKEFGLDTNGIMTLIIPNSYLIYWNISCKGLLKRLQREQTYFWNSRRKSKADSLGLSPYQVYVLASIVEEETTKAKDKGPVSSVYLNRLSTGMPLQADPTVRFALGDFRIKRILKGHLDIISPYNTYRNAGLPPGPICTPSISTIDSVLHAPKTPYYYFAARSDFSGYSVFASSYEEHLKNARAYQKALDTLLSMKNNR